MPPEIFYSIVGQNISRFRQDKNLTQEKLAKAVHLDRTSISNIEQGRQKILLHFLFEIAEALDVNPTQLLPQEDNLSKSAGGFSIPRNLPAPEKLWLNSVIAKKIKNEQ